MARMIKSNPSAGALLVTAIAVGGGIYLLSRKPTKKGNGANWVAPTDETILAEGKVEATEAETIEQLFKLEAALKDAFTKPPFAGKTFTVEEAQTRGFFDDDTTAANLPQRRAELDKEVEEGIKRMAESTKAGRAVYPIAIVPIHQKGVKMTPQNFGSILVLLESINLTATPATVTGSVIGSFATSNIKGLPKLGSKLTLKTSQLTGSILAAVQTAEGVQPPTPDEARPDLTPVAVAPGEFGSAQFATFEAQPGANANLLDVIARIPDAGLATTFDKKVFFASDPMVAGLDDVGAALSDLKMAESMNAMNRQIAAGGDPRMLRETGASMRYLLAVVKIKDGRYILVRLTAGDTERAMNTGMFGGRLIGPTSILDQFIPDGSNTPAS